MARHLRLAAVGVRPPSAESKTLERGTMLDLVIHHIRREIEPALAWRPDLILLPERCDRPLDLEPSEEERWDAESSPRVRDLLRDMARRGSAVVVCGVGRSLVVVADRDGSTRDVDRGADAPPALVPSSIGTIALCLGDDLQDAVVMKRYQELRPDLLLLASRFPGGMLEQYWAFSCRAHLASAVLYRSDLRLPCRIVSPVGAVLAFSTTAQTHARAIVNLDSAVVHLDDHREKLLALQTDRGDHIRITDPGHLGAVCVSNEAPSGTIQEILANAGIATIDQYFSRYLSARDRSPRPVPRRDGHGA